MLWLTGHECRPEFRRRTGSRHVLYIEPMRLFMISICFTVHPQWKCYIYIYIYIYMCVCVCLCRLLFWMHWIVQTLLIDARAGQRMYMNLWTPMAWTPNARPPHKDIHIYIYIYIVIYRREGLSIPAYFIPAHIEGAWSKILGCCCCSAALDRTTPIGDPKQNSLTYPLFS